jgi:hypothetical protein
LGSGFPPVSIEVAEWTRQLYRVVLPVTPGAQTSVPGDGIISTIAQLRAEATQP